MRVLCKGAELMKYIFVVGGVLVPFRVEVVQREAQLDARTPSTIRPGEFISTPIRVGFERYEVCSRADMERIAEEAKQSMLKVYDLLVKGDQDMGTEAEAEARK